MTMRIITLLLAAVCTLSLSCPALSVAMGKEVTGTISKIEGSNVTVLDSYGNEEKIEAKDKRVVKDLKVGDKISVKNDMLTREGVESPAPGNK